MDVHARDVVERMIQEGCSSETDFQWTMQLRYYWDMTVNNCVVRQTNAAFNYGFEYLGNQPRLVITPLTDRCYLTCTGGSMTVAVSATLNVFLGPCVYVGSLSLL